MFTEYVDTDLSVQTKARINSCPQAMTEGESIYGDDNYDTCVCFFWDYLLYDCQEEAP